MSFEEIIQDEQKEAKVKEEFLNAIFEKFSSSTQFFVLSSALFTFYILYGLMLELIFTLEGMKLHGWFLTLIQFGFYSLFALLQLTINQNGLKKRIPFKVYFLIAFLTVGTMGFSNTSMGYLNFPTQVVFKSCKLIPVMIGSMLILKKKYNCLQIIACLFMTVGLIWFTLADNVIQPDFNFKGVLLICLALLCDALIGNVQEMAMKDYNEPCVVIVLYSYSLGFLVIFFALAISGTLLSSLQFSIGHPWEVYGRCTLMSAAGFCGVQVVLQLIHKFGVLLAVTVTTMRKAFSILLSFLLFTKPFTVHYVWGGLLVSFGIYLNVVGKNNTGVLVHFQKALLAFSRWRSTSYQSSKEELLIV